MAGFQKFSIIPSNRAVIDWTHFNNQLSAMVEFGGNKIVRSHKTKGSETACMVCYSIKSVVSKLRNIFTITSAIQTPESSGNLSDKCSRDAGNNGEKSSHGPVVL